MIMVFLSDLKEIEKVVLIKHPVMNGKHIHIFWFIKLV